MHSTAGKLPFLEWAVATRPMPGQTESGDQYVVHPVPGGALMGVVDGLGHGPDAAAAAKGAVAVLEAHAHEPLIALVKRCHEALRRTCGVVMTLSAFGAQDNSLTWLGVGNVTGLLVRTDALARPARDSVLQRGGVVGYLLPPLQTSTLAVAPGDTLVLATDGIRDRFADGLDVDRLPQQIADDIMAAHGKPSDDALVLVVRLGAMAL
jgi:hypothetical protein